MCKIIGWVKKTVHNLQVTRQINCCHRMINDYSHTLGPDGVQEMKGYVSELRTHYM